jgi:methanogenic corrinoid protein MtbC1
MSSLVAAGIPPAQASEAAREEGGAAQPPERAEAFEEHPLAVAIQGAALTYDEDTTVEAVRDAVKQFGWAAAVDEVLFTALRRIGEYWGQNTLVSANEHFTSEIIRRELASAIAKLPLADRIAPAVLLACAEDERHDLGLLALCLFLREQGVRAIYLGADVPAADIVLAIKQTKADAVCLSATTESARASLARTAREIIAARAGTRLFVGGPALEGSAVDIAGTVLPASPAAAAQLIAKAVSKGS